MNKRIRKLLSNISINANGWRTNRKIVVLESDDWGAVRMPSQAVFNKLLDSDIRVDLCPYNTYDCLEDKEDLSHLFQVLSTVRDGFGNNAVLTANTNVANPDFEKIKEDQFKRYYYKSFIDSYSEFQSDNSTILLIKEGINSKIYFPQFHGREHLNYNIWLTLLQDFENTHLIKAFHQGVFGLSFATSKQITVPYLASFIYSNLHERRMVETSIKEGLEIFKSIFGFASDSIIAPLYSWTKELEESFKEFDISYIQGSRIRKEYQNSHVEYIRSKRKMGLDSNGLVHLIRNAQFEPTLTSNTNEADECLRDIEMAFLMKKPAIISTHRVNYMGRLVEKNRSNNLKSLSYLLNSIVSKWPNVEFMNSAQLARIIQTSQHVE